LQSRRKRNNAKEEIKKKNSFPLFEAYPILKTVIYIRFVYFKEEISEFLWTICYLLSEIFSFFVLFEDVLVPTIFELVSFVVFIMIFLRRIILFVETEKIKKTKILITKAN
jgi:hypothetical protein